MLRRVIVGRAGGMRGDQADALRLDPRSLQGGAHGANGAVAVRMRLRQMIVSDGVEYEDI